MDSIFLAHLVTLRAEEGGSEQLHPVNLILEASLVVQLVVVILLFMAIGSGFVSFAKFYRLTRAQGASRNFLARFWDKSEGNEWTSARLEGLYAELGQFDDSPIAVVFRAGYVELARVLGSPDGSSEADIENVERALRRTAGNEMTEIETMLPFLATTGSTGPFIGLFGTVWGIMQSFIAIHGSGSASLDVVAPAIAEALIATAIGLVAAIPAVMAYNYFLRRLRVMESELESFSYDFLNIVRRHFLRGRG